MTWRYRSSRSGAVITLLCRSQCDIWRLVRISGMLIRTCGNIMSTCFVDVAILDAIYPYKNSKLSQIKHRSSSSGFVLHSRKPDSSPGRRSTAIMVRKCVTALCCPVYSSMTRLKYDTTTGFRCRYLPTSQPRAITPLQFIPA